MNKEKLFFDSADGIHRIAAYIYTDETVEPRGIIQLSHGMCEYVERYEDLAAFFTKNGYIFAGNDHLGHGNSVEQSEYGIFSENDVIVDLYNLTNILKKRYKKLPLILYGHSMGSFFARWYIEKYKEVVDAVIISGTAGPSILNILGRELARFITILKPDGFVSDFLVDLNFGKYNKKIPNNKTKSDWLTRDERVVKLYEADPKCQFKFSASAYLSMLTVLTRVNNRSKVEKIRKDLKILLIAGRCDPVGDYGRGVLAVYEMLKDVGIKDVTLYFDEFGRHELHNELNKEEVFEYIKKWLNEKMDYNL